MSWRRWTAVCGIVVVALGIGGFLWSARDRCPDVIAQVDESVVDLPAFTPPGAAGTRSWPPRVEERASALLDAGASLGEPDAIVLLDPQETYANASFSLVEGSVLLEHQVMLPPEHGTDELPAMTMHDVREGTLRWARLWDNVSAGFGPVGDSLALLQNGGALTPSWVIAVDPTSGELRTCTPLDSESIEEAVTVPVAGTMMVASPGDDGTPMLSSVDADAGAVVWERALEQTTGPVQSLHATDEVVVFSGVRTGISLRTLEATAATADLRERDAAGGLAVHAVSADGGEPRWSYASEDPDAVRPYVHTVAGVNDQTVIVTADRSDDVPVVDRLIHSRVVALDVATGEEVWSWDLPTSTWRTPDVRLFGDVVVYEELAENDSRVDLVARSATTGEQLWRISDHEPLHSMTVDESSATALDGSLYVATSDGLDIVDLRTGERSLALEGFPVRAVKADGTTIGVQVYIYNDLAALILYDTT